MSIELPENLKSKMTNSQIGQKLDLDKLDERFQKQLLRICKKRMLISKLKKFNSFFDSDEWQKNHDQPGAHDIAYAFLREIFGRENVSIYDKSNLTHGKSFMDKLTDEEKTFVVDIDTNQKIGIYKVGPGCAKYTGTWVYIYVFDTWTDTWEWAWKWDW